MSDFQLGQRVAYSTHVRRRHARPGEFLGPQRIWSTNPGPGILQDNLWDGGEGVIVGKRTLSDGNVTYYGDAPGEYVPSKTFTAWLIAYDLQRKPVHVLPEHITALD